MWFAGCGRGGDCGTSAEGAAGRGIRQAGTDATAGAGGCVAEFLCAEEWGSGLGAAGKASGNCAGTEPVVSFVVDYRPFKRVDTYAGVMYSDVTGGLANGYLKTNNTAFTAGVRVSF